MEKRPTYSVYQRGPYRGYDKKMVAAWRKALSKLPKFSCVSGCHRCCKVTHREGLVLIYKDEIVSDVQLKKFKVEYNTK